MDIANTVDPAQFVHVRILLSMVVSLAIARLLSGLARFVQHPGRLKVYGVHLLWTAFMLVLLVHFWWWEFALIRLPMWHFGTFVFFIAYAAVLFLLCALLFPDDIAEYSGYRDYFMSRKAWFFGLLGSAYVLDMVDTWLKGPDYVHAQGIEYLLRGTVGAALCIVAARTGNQRFHQLFAGFSLAYQLGRVLLLYDVLS